LNERRGDGNAVPDPTVHSKLTLVSINARAALSDSERTGAVIVLGQVRIPTMLDLLFIALGLGFFAVGCLYLYACDRL
jgi:hypothetical protein